MILRSLLTKGAWHHQIDVTRATDLAADPVRDEISMFCHCSDVVSKVSTTMPIIYSCLSHVMCSYQHRHHHRYGNVYKDARKIFHDIKSMASCTEHQSKNQHKCSCHPLQLMSMKGPCPRCCVFEESVCVVNAGFVCCVCHHSGLKSSSLVLLAILCMYHISVFPLQSCRKDASMPFKGSVCVPSILICGLSV